MKELLALFFTEYQKGIDLREFEKRFILVWDIDKIVWESAKSGLLFSVCKFSNIGEAHQIIPDFYFLPVLETTSNEYVFVFATSSDGFDYAVDKQTGEVVLIDYDGEEIFFSIAKDEVSFLKVLMKLVEFKSFFRRGVKVEASISKKYREECIQLAGGEKYSKFYRFTVISQDDQPSVPFTLP